MPASGVPAEASAEGKQPKGIRVDLRTRVLTQSHQVFLARPGRECQFFEDFQAAGAIGPELPGMDLQTGVSLEDQNDLDARLKKAQAVRAWRRKGKPDNEVPATDPADHRGEAFSSGVTQLRATLAGYFEKAQKGDIAIIFPRSYLSDALVVEFTGEPTDITTVRIERAYGSFELPARRFRELARIQRRKLPQDVIEIISKPNAFVLVGNKDRPFFYDLAYGSYTFQGDFSTRLDVTENAFNTIDELSISAFTNFVAYHTYQSKFAESAKPLSFWDAVEASHVLEDYAPELNINVNSPGALRVFSQFMIPLVVSTMFALALNVGEEAAEAAKAGTLIIGNSSAPHNDACTAEVHEAVIEQLKMLDADDWARACRIARRAAEGTGLTAGPSAKSEP